MSRAVIVGSAFEKAELHGVALTPERVATSFGDVTLYRFADGAYVLFRHGMPHQFLPNQIPYRAHAAALKAVGCSALMVTSSVGVLNPEIALFEPLIVSDVFMPENRLPDGSACTMFTKPSPEHGHLVLDEGLISEALAQDVARRAGRALQRVVFAYAQGPRTKTKVENRWFNALGIDVNSMSVGPELVLANELGIPTVAVVTGHKYSLPAGMKPRKEQQLTEAALADSLAHARRAVAQLAVSFLKEGSTVPFKNFLYRFGAARHE